MPIKIFIDQGHNPSGYHNSGSEGNGLFEQNITYMVGLYLSYILNSDYRFEARLSRPNASTVLGTTNNSSLRERVTMANNWPADYFISLHTNANPNPGIQGSEMYVYSFYTESYYLAENILSELVRRLDMINNGIYTAPSFYVLRNTNMPSVLVELGYISNPEDAFKLSTRQYDFAFAIYNGLLNFFGFDFL